MRSFCVRMGFWCVMAFGFLPGCWSRPMALEYDILERGDAVALEPAGDLYRAIDSQAEFSSLYARLHRERFPTPEPPEVDFSAALVLFVAMQQQPTAGYTIEPPGPRLQGGILVVPVSFGAPPMDRPRATVLTRPYLLLRVERPAAVVTVEFRSPEGDLLARSPLK